MTPRRNPPWRTAHAAGETPAAGPHRTRRTRRETGWRTRLGDPRRAPTWRQALRRDWQLYSLAVLPLLFFLVFRYCRCSATSSRSAGSSPAAASSASTGWGCTTSGCSSTTRTFWQVFTNTLDSRGADPAVLLPAADRAGAAAQRGAARRFKRFVQSVSYLPHFLSIVIVAGIVMQSLSVDGTVNQLVAAGRRRRRSRSCSSPSGSAPSTSPRRSGRPSAGARSSTSRRSPPSTSTSTRRPGSTAPTGWRQTWHVTLPGIRPTMVTLLILNIGTFMAVGFEKILLLYNPLTYPTADVISTYLYRMGLSSPATSATPRRSACSRR